MNITIVIGFSSSILIGVSLGLIGGGGSLLTLPILVYLLGINPVLSTTYSLFIVGITSLIGSVNYMQKRLVNYQVVLLFVFPAFITVYFARQYVIPAIPDPVFAYNWIILSKSVTLLLFFAFVMTAAAYSMIRDKRDEPKETSSQWKLNRPLIVISGAIIGLITGIIGVGGGFLIIPSLVLLARLPMKTAVGTSLLIIAIKSLIGFVGDLANLSINWIFLLEFTLLSVLGTFMGAYLSRFIEGEKLKKSFGWFVMVISIGIIVKELVGNN